MKLKLILLVTLLTIFGCKGTPSNPPILLSCSGKTNIQFSGDTHQTFTKVWDKNTTYSFIFEKVLLEPRDSDSNQKREEAYMWTVIEDGKTVKKPQNTTYSSQESKPTIYTLIQVADQLITITEENTSLPTKKYDGWSNKSETTINRLSGDWKITSRNISTKIDGKKLYEVAFTSGSCEITQKKF
ncbi:hypothetical protein ICN28_06195 [Polynucleobacter sp. 30F-ANTBAC]|uniref:hypothetical protein n=1 Tax=Polynucleobacter sp. 30F-ANTBAC TaxID=2689095 RepID=UPI001C0DE6F4|nr:hypothetical protein [Polynucleobacter sp. 30F-ANTBAC]MBU3600103.1 hypothetical protein [Polynucleobacter sp. 30F-ANTBAC]